MEQWITAAMALGFHTAMPLDIATLIPRQDVRDMCADDKCRAYGKNWTCPPHCGTLEQCAAQLQSYRQGILVQTVGYKEKLIDTKVYRRTEERHLAMLRDLTAQIRQTHPYALSLGCGGCRVCQTCAWPEPCRFPELASSSMEGYGLFVTQVCRDNGAEYFHGTMTITYTGCILF